MMASMKLGSKAEAFQLEGRTWRCLTELASDVAIEVGEVSFNLHKFPLMNRSGLLRKMISEFQGEEGKECVLQLHEIPGAAKSFELVAKFCYDIKIELNAHNVVPLRCAAEYLRMTDGYVGGNLITQTENFLNQVFSNWKDSIKALEACESVLPCAEELQIVSRCIDSLASKAFADPNIFSWTMAGSTSTKSPAEDGLWNEIVPADTKPEITDWWYEDVAFLSLPLFKKLILAMDAKGLKPENIAGALTFYAKRFLPGLSRNLCFRDTTTRLGHGTSVSAPSESDQKVFIEEIVDLLPLKKGVTSTKFLLGMLRTSMILHASESCRDNLERRIGAQLDEAAIEDILIPNLGYSAETLYDTDCFRRILEHFMLMEQQSSALNSPAIVDERQIMTASPSLTPVTMVAKLVDGYLAEVAADVNLKPPMFTAIAAVVPDEARPLDDGIYRAIDIYLKSHPWLTESEREPLCRLMDCQKLSMEACTHAAQNERLPLRVVVQVLFFEQLRLRTSIASWFFVPDGSDNSQGSSGNLGQQKSSGSRGTQEDIGQEHEDNQQSVDEMRLRVMELEKECLSMRREIEKLGKSKSSWNIFPKRNGFRNKSLSESKDQQ